jgi:hypothetical protein
MGNEISLSSEKSCKRHVGDVEIIPRIPLTTLVEGCQVVGRRCARTPMPSQGNEGIKNQPRHVCMMGLVRTKRFIYFDFTN